MLNPTTKKVYIAELLLEKERDFGITPSALAKFQLDHGDWNSVIDIIQNDPISYFYIMKCCLKYGYLSKFAIFFDNIDFKNTVGYVETLIVCCLRYRRYKQLRTILSKYESQIDINYNEFQILKAASINCEDSLYKFILKNVDIKFVKKFYEDKYNMGFYNIILSFTYFNKDLTFLQFIERINIENCLKNCLKILK